MTPTAWADLPNAKHIDLLLADLEKNPDKWSAARSAAWTAAWDAAWNAVWDAERGAAWDAAFDSAWYAARTDAQAPAWGAAASGADARDAILALIAYDDCIYLLDEKPEYVQMLGLLGNQQALLLYPACIVLQKEMA